MKKRVGSIALTVLVALVALASVVSMPSAEASITGRRLQLLGDNISWKKPLGDIVPKAPERPKPKTKADYSPSLTFRNCYSGPRFVSLGWYDDGAWKTWGTYPILGGDEKTFSSLFKNLGPNKSVYFRVEESDQTRIRYNSDEFRTKILCRSKSTSWMIVRESGAGENEYKVNGKYRSCPVKHVFQRLRYEQRDSKNKKLFTMGCS